MKLKTLSIATVGLFLFSLAVFPALAAGTQFERMPVRPMVRNMVINSNSAMVGNCVEVDANTGMNVAGGSYGGDGGDGGAILNRRGDEVEDSATGAGGAGGNAGIGGTVVTGNAVARANVSNTVNSNLAGINYCACGERVNPEECGCGSDMIINRNRAKVFNRVRVAANTGMNMAEGSYGGDGGDGGAILNRGGDEVEDSATGAGGDGGAGSSGGLVQTGVSNARADVVNVVNRNITRISR